MTSSGVRPSPVAATSVHANGIEINRPAPRHPTLLRPGTVALTVKLIMRKVLVCPPDHYGIEYEINPWMDRAQKALPGLARSQWQRLLHRLQALGCEVEVIPAQPRLPDMVFTANAGLVAGMKF